MLRLIRWPLFILLPFVIAAGIALKMNPQWLRIERIDVELAPNSEQDLLFQRIKIALAPRLKSIEKKYFWEVPLEELRQWIHEDKRVRHVAVHREFPSRVRILIEPHTPVLAFLAKDQRVHPVATDATLLPSLPIPEAPDLPLLRGQKLESSVEWRERALELYASLPEEGPFRRSHVSEIHFSESDGFSVFVSGANAEVKLGEADFGPKISRVQKVLSYLESQNVKGRVIDARFSKKVVVRVRNTP